MMKFPPSRTVCILALAVAVAVPLCAALVVAQGQRRAAAAPRPSPPPATPLEAATRLFYEGKFDDLDAAIAKLDSRDPSVVALKAQGLIARGKYADAEGLLQPVAQRAPSSEAALQLGLLQKLLTRPAADQTLERVASLASSAQNAVEMARAARALRELGRVADAKSAYIEATRAAPNNVEIEASFGDFFLEKYNNTEAMKSYERVLDLDPRYVPALLGAARVLGDDDPPQATGAIKRLLQINPASVDANIFLAGQAADVDHKGEARELLGKALAVNPSSLEAHSALAALAAVEDKTQEFDAEVAKVLAIAPADGDVYRTAGELLARNYRFEEAVAMTRRALALAPRDAQALADLGAQLLRTGDEPSARQALESSYDIDPFNAVVVNSLRMLDNLDKFETIRDGDLIVRMHKDEAPVLKEYVIPLAHKALATMAAKYEMTVKGPILIEMFPKHDDFAVRTLGLPGMVGALGACFGQVVTLDSPMARQPPGDFLWEATLWHELGHVITIQMSNSRVPRWLTEGISEWEETQARKDWTRPGEAMFARTVSNGQAIKLKDLNEAYQDPRRITLAYYQGRLVVDYMVTTFGQSGLNKLLRAYGQGLDTNAALKQVLNTDLESMQSGFDQYIERTFGPLQKALTTPKDVDLGRATVDSLRTLARENPQSYPVHVALGLALRKAGSNDEAMQVFERAATLAPTAVGPESPHAQMADIALDKKDRKRAIAELTALFAVDFENLGATEQLAELMKEDGVNDPARLGPIYERIVALNPYNGEARSSLGRVALQHNDYDFAAREFRTAIALKPIDPAVAHTDLAESYLKAGKRDDAKRQALAALEIAPAYARAQDLLLQVAEPAGARK
jgi:tetratricopeptide (TPR) repeat protein